MNNIVRRESEYTPATVVDLDTDFVQKLVFFSVLVEGHQVAEVSVIHGSVFCLGKFNVHMHAADPFVDATFNLCEMRQGRAQNETLTTVRTKAMPGTGNGLKQKGYLTPSSSLFANHITLTII